MIRDVITVTWKEWMEYRDQLFRLRRGGLSAIVIVIMLGVFTPLQLGPVWLTSPIMLLYWPLLASGMVSTLIADAFAGERERHTLEALLATRLSDSSILVGKVIAGVLYGVGFTLANIVTGYLVIVLKHHRGGPVPFPLGQVALVMLLVVLTCTALAGVGVFISLRAATVRQAQQTLGIIMMVMLIGPFLFLQMIESADRMALLARLTTLGVERMVWRAALVLLVASVTINLLALARFKRGKLGLE